MKMKRILAAALAGIMILSMPVYAEESMTEETIMTETEAETIVSETQMEESETIFETEETEFETVIETEFEEIIEMETAEETMELTEASSDSVEGFVTRLYSKALNRKPDTAGLNDWVSQLKSGRAQGARVAQGFIDSVEFKNRKLSNKDYITVLYRTFFDREPDKGGLSYWMDALDDGLSRLYVFRGFAESNEFSVLCQKFGIIRGNADLTEARDQNGDVTKFVIRCYRLCLNREPDLGGLNDWCHQLNSGAKNATEVAYGFIFSQEFQKKNLSNSDYVKIMYRVFLDREADEAGLKDWVSKLEDGYCRHHIFNGFSGSSEFAKICGNYGVAVGNANMNSDWMAAYVQKCRSLGKDDCVMFYDLNQDGIPEMFRQLYTFVYIYTYQNNQVVELLESGMMIGAGEYNGKRYAATLSAHTGYYVDTLYEFSGGVFRELAKEESWRDGSARYTVLGRSASASAYASYRPIYSACTIERLEKPAHSVTMQYFCEQFH